MTIEESGTVVTTGRTIDAGQGRAPQRYGGTKAAAAASETTGGFLTANWTSSIDTAIVAAETGTEIVIGTTIAGENARDP